MYSHGRDDAAQFRKDLFSVLDRIAAGGEKVTVSTEKGNAVLVSEEEWDNVIEALYLLSVPGMMDSVKAAEEDHPDGCVDWESYRSVLM